MSRPPRSPVVHTPIHDDDDELQSYANFDPTRSRRHSSLEYRSGSNYPTKTYALRVDPQQNDRAVELKLWSLARPHMRAFHYAWLSFFIAFVGWFSIPPLMPTIKAQLHLTKDQVANSNIAAVASTIAGRIVIGPLCDRYGPRVIQAALLVLGAIPVACGGLAHNYTSFMIVRFVIGLVGCSFVSTTFWTSIMFSKEVVGTANALAAGWGNLGAGATYLITPLIFDLLTKGSGISDDLGWRLTLLCPAIFMVVIGVMTYKFSDDCPHGNFKDLRKTQRRRQPDDSLTTDHGALKPGTVDVPTALWAAALKPASWILAIQYACSFGVELQVHNVLSLYYYEDFVHDDCVPARDHNKCRVLTQTTASLISSLFGLMCIFARAMGGVSSDLASHKFGMRGRVIVQFVAFAGQAVALFVYARIRTVGSSIPSLIIFGIFVQACTGTTYAIVPYVLPSYTGATSGIVGAGGNIGALCWGFLFKGVGDRATSFRYLSAFVAFSAGLCAVTYIDDEGSVWRCKKRKLSVSQRTNGQIPTEVV